MDSHMSDEELWSLVDRGGSAVDEHLALHPDDHTRVQDLRGTIGAVALAVEVASMPPPTRIGDYRIEREIGRGGGGVVYEAWQEDPPRRVALKVLRDCDQADRHALGRLRRESEALGRLSHPHVATIYEAGRTSDGHPFIAMELVHGRTLAGLARRNDLSLRERVRLFRDVCEAVHHAHRQGVVHRDLKPSNVLIDEMLGVKVVDFGLARLRDAAAAHVSHSGIVVGTLGYMSPEQAAGEVVDERTDVYSLGVVLYELATGSLPFDMAGKSALQAVRILSDKHPPAPRSRDRNLDRDLETIMLKAMEKDPAQRYGSAAALAEDVGCWLASRPILARRASFGYRVRKLAARNRFVTALVGVLLMVALAAGYASAFHPHLVHLSGGWYAEVSPFDGVRWVGEHPQVRVGTEWYDLVSIDSLDADYITGFCKQDARNVWRKRFSEDLLQVLNLMGDWPLQSVDLVLREPGTGRRVEMRDVAFDNRKRRGILDDRNARSVNVDFKTHALEIGGRKLELVSVDGLGAQDVTGREARSLLFDYDHYCDVVGRSPGDRMCLEMRDPKTGVVETFDVPRVAPTQGVP
jgi:tRNA A-37 threonylcarbamoyl transferase component Bud32